MPRRAFHFDESVVVVHDAVNNRQSKSGSFADSFGSEEGFKDSPPHFFCHADSGIADHDADARVGPTVEASFAYFVRFDHFRADGELAARRHRVAGIDANIEKRSAQLIRIGPHRRQPRCQFQCDGDRFRKRFDQFAQRQNDVVDLAAR